MMAKQIPDWATPGAQVAVYHRNPMGATVTLKTVERLTATQIVTSDGSRWTDMSPSDTPAVRQVGKGYYSDPMLPVDDPKVQDALALAAINRQCHRMMVEMEAFQRSNRTDPALVRPIIAEATKLLALLENGTIQ